MKNKERWETITMGDLISRQMAISEIKEYIVDPNQAISEYEDNVFNYNSGLKSAVQAIVDLPPAQQEQSIAEWQKDFREYINTLNIPRDDYRGIMEYIDEVPFAEIEPKHAHVIIDEDGNMWCSNCGSSNCFDNYCGYCGAKLIGERMSGEEDD